MASMAVYGDELPGRGVILPPGGTRRRLVGSATASRALVRAPTRDPIPHGWEAEIEGNHLGVSWTQSCTTTPLRLAA